MINQYLIKDNYESLKDLPHECIDLIYFDPPFNTGRDFYDFDDQFKSMDDYRDIYLFPRVEECIRVLKKTGNIIIHVDPTISHHIKIILDQLLGPKKFVNEIAWVTGGNAKNKKKMNRFHDTIICYKMSNQSTFNPQYKPYDSAYKEKNSVKKCEYTGKEYVTTAIHNSQPHINPRLNLRYEWNGHQKQWYVSKSKMINLHEENRLKYSSSGVPRIKRFLEEMDGVPIRDVWSDISNIQGGEKLDYATQKPVKLLERIVKMFTDEGDLVLDPFAGSGTTGRACIRLNRNYLLFDINEKGKEVFLKSKKLLLDKTN